MLANKIVFHLDTNLLNSKQELCDVNKLEFWHDSELITLVWSSIAHKEALNSSDKVKIKKANTHIFTIDDENGDDGLSSDLLKKEIYRVFGINEKSHKNQINDAEIVYIAAKYSAILVTNDGESKRQPLGILGRRHLLTKYLKIMAPDEAVKFIEELYKKKQ